jgi:hypothetical protein
MKSDAEFFAGIKGSDNDLAQVVTLDVNLNPA